MVNVGMCLLYKEVRFKLGRYVVNIDTRLLYTEVRFKLWVICG